MHHSSHSSPMQSSTSGPHSLEVERRLTRAETTTDAHETRISYLERAMQVVIWAIGALATSKTGDIAELLLSIVKAKT